MSGRLGAGGDSALDSVRDLVIESKADTVFQCTTPNGRGCPASREIQPGAIRAGGGLEITAEGVKKQVPPQLASLLEGVRENRGDSWARSTMPGEDFASARLSLRRCCVTEGAVARGI